MEKLSFVKLYHPWQHNPYSDPPLGLLSVASEARKIENLEVILLDQAHEKEISESNYFGISATTLEFPEALEQARRIKKAFPSAKIIVGGAHFDALPESDWGAQINDLPFDVICRGEGEATIAEAINYLREAKNEKKLITHNGPLIDLNTLDFPARDLLDKVRYFVPGVTFSERVHVDGNSTTIMDSRGCPFSCSFCASPLLHNRKLRFRSLDKTIAELEHLKNDYKVNSLRWQDDCVPLNLRKNSGLVDYLKSSNIYSRGSARTDQINPQMLDLLWNAGFREIGFGIESAEQRVLDLLDKRTNIEKNKQALRATRERGLKTRAFIMTGLPNETKDSAKIMIDFLEETKPDVVTLTSFIPLPGCDIYNNPEKYGIRIKTKDWSKYDIALKWDAGTEWAHEVSTLTSAQMEANRELLKQYIFNRGMSNVPIYNKPYIANVTEP